MPEANATVEQRVRALETNVDELCGRMGGIEREVAEAAQQNTAALDQEKRDRAAGDNTIREDLKSAQTGGVHVAMAGVWLLVAGMVMTTFPGELTRLAIWVLQPA